MARENSQLSSDVSMTAEQYRGLQTVAKRSKYGVRTDARGKAARTVDGILFASSKEAMRWIELKLLQRGRKIRDLKRQYPLELLASGVDENLVVIGKYFADFRYVDIKTGAIVYEDSKGAKTDVYELKKKIVEANYGIKILET